VAVIVTAPCTENKRSPARATFIESPRRLETSPRAL
jgi:hypothetical protein